MLQAQQLEDDSSGPVLTTPTIPRQTEKGQTPGLQMRDGQMALGACTRNGYDVSYRQPILAGYSHTNYAILCRTIKCKEQ